MSCRSKYGTRARNGEHDASEVPGLDADASRHHGHKAAHIRLGGTTINFPCPTSQLVPRSACRSSDKSLGRNCHPGARSLTSDCTCFGLMQKGYLQSRSSLRFVRTRAREGGGTTRRKYRGLTPVLRGIKAIKMSKFGYHCISFTLTRTRVSTTRRQYSGLNPTLRGINAIRLPKFGW